MMALDYILVNISSYVIHNERKLALKELKKAKKLIKKIRR